MGPPRGEGGPTGAAAAAACAACCRSRGHPACWLCRWRGACACLPGSRNRHAGADGGERGAGAGRGGCFSPWLRRLPAWGTAYCRGTSPVSSPVVALQALFEELHPPCTRVCHFCFLPEQVRPYLMADGGNVEFVEIDGPVVRCCLLCSVLYKLQAAAWLDMPAARAPGGCKRATEPLRKHVRCRQLPDAPPPLSRGRCARCTCRKCPLAPPTPSVPPPARPGPPRPVRSPSLPQVYLRLAGACGSCPSSLTTMTMGIKRRLMERIPVSGRSALRWVHADFCSAMTVHRVPLHAWSALWRGAGGGWGSCRPAAAALLNRQLTFPCAPLPRNTLTPNP